MLVTGAVKHLARRSYEYAGNNNYLPGNSRQYTISEDANKTWLSLFAMLIFAFVAFVVFALVYVSTVSCGDYQDELVANRQLDFCWIESYHDFDCS